MIVLQADPNISKSKQDINIRSLYIEEPSAVAFHF